MTGCSLAKVAQHLSSRYGDKAFDVADLAVAEGRKLEKSVILQGLMLIVYTDDSCQTFRTLKLKSSTVSTSTLRRLWCGVAQTAVKLTRRRTGCSCSPDTNRLS